MPRPTKSPARKRGSSPPPPTLQVSANDELLKLVDDALSESFPVGDEQQGGRSSLRSSLREVRRRVRSALAEQLPETPGKARVRGAAQILRRGRERLREDVKQRMQVVKQRQSQVVSRLRRKITGQGDRRVREYLRDLAAEPPVIKLRDKMSFTCGVLGCFVVEAWALVAPRYFSYCYALVIVPLLIMRVYLYASAGWQYFLIDFCYFSNASCLAQLAFFPTSAFIFRANFLLTTGPLAMAVPTWRNSMVFHSLDRVTSSYIHVLPPIFAFVVRWFPPPTLDLGDAGFECHASVGCVVPALPFVSSMLSALAFYVAWQGFYLLYTELLFPPALQRDTSIRVLASGKAGKAPPACYSGITFLTYKVSHLLLCALLWTSPPHLLSPPLSCLPPLPLPAVSPGGRRDARDAKR